MYSRAYVTPHVGVSVETQWLEIGSKENCHPSPPRLLAQEDSACKMGGFGRKNVRNPKGNTTEGLEVARAQRALILEEKRQYELARVGALAQARAQAPSQ